MERFYQKFNNGLKPGTELYCNFLGKGIVGQLFEEYFTFIPSNEPVDAEDKWRIRKYYDIGKILFFTEEDMRHGNKIEIDNDEKYMPYMNAPTLDHVRNKIKNQNKMFDHMDYYDKELYYEREIFNDVIKYVKNKYLEAKEKKDLHCFVNNGNSDSFDPDISENRKRDEYSENEWKLRAEEPYYIEIIEQNGNPVYLGEKDIPERDIVDIRNQRYRDYVYEKHSKSLLELYRQFTIKEKSISSFEDSVNKLRFEGVKGDPDINAILEFYRDIPQMVSIIRSLDEEQYKVIKAPVDEKLLLEGCAGSGKSMIMLHRLSSIVYNYPEAYERENIIILSPSVVLDRQSDCLIEELDLQGIKKGSILKFYVDLINEYVFRQSLYYLDNSIAFTNLDDNTVVYNSFQHSDFIENIYSKESVEDYTKALYSLFYSNTKSYGDFSVKEYGKMIMDHSMTKLYGGILNETVDLDSMELITKMAEEYKIVCDMFYIINAKERVKELEILLKKGTDEINDYQEKKRHIDERFNQEIKEIQNEVEVVESHIVEQILDIRSYKEQKGFDAFKNPNKLENMRKNLSNLESEDKALLSKIRKLQRKRNIEQAKLETSNNFVKYQNEYEALNIFFRSEDVIPKEAKRNQKGELSREPSLFKPAIDFYKKYVDRIPVDIVKRCGGLGALWHENYKLIDFKKRLEDFLCGINRENFVVEVINSAIYYIKEKSGFDTFKIFEFEFFLFLKGLNILFNELTQTKKLIAIDEFQDFSMTEIDLISKIYPNSIFNLYGETLQSIGNKGIKIADSTSFPGFSHYTLNFNYRNAKEITEYINWNIRLKSPINAIGLPGIVKTIQSCELSNIEFNHKKRSALIVRSLKQYNMLSYDKSKDKIVTENSLEVNFNCLNVIFTKHAKGLEFEEVFVFTKDMSNNEKYVAFSRAKEKLFIIENDDLETVK